MRVRQKLCTCLFGIAADREGYQKFYRKTPPDFPNVTFRCLPQRGDCDRMRAAGKEWVSC